MTKTIRVKDRDLETVDELVNDPHDELTWAEKINEVVDMACEWNTEIQQ